MSNEANIQLLQESLEALNAHDAERFMDTIHEEVTWSLDASKAPVSGTKALRAVIEAMIVAMPDILGSLLYIINGLRTQTRWQLADDDPRIHN